MYNLNFISQWILYAGTLVGFIIGASLYFKKRKPLFLQIITCALGCAMLKQLSFLVSFLGSEFTEYTFRIDFLGLVGCFFFFFSASYGQIDGLGDSRDKSFKKYRIISLAAPVSIILLFSFIMFSGATLSELVVSGILFIVIAMTSYYNLKHLILPDVENGILKSIRQYNLFVLILCYITVIGQISQVNNIEILTVITTLISAVLFFSVIIVAGRGVKKWFL